ncbi:MAG: DUF4832 domain-containing protein [Luteolibacter sp.]|uniref:DUF4832 domain-containing protein n=1 Tax=Luteolibacter sp. TaxID=1962973 RepID=UPI003263FCC5
MKSTLVLLLLAMRLPAGELPLQPIPLQSTITEVQPMTGIVFWEDSGRNKTDAIQLEYSYMRYSDVVSQRSAYQWAAVEKKLNAISRRGHQGILRFYFVYPGKQTAVPDYIKALPDYHETQGISENKPTGFPDWSNPELKRFVKEFHTRFAARYDHDPRLAFVQTGFGLWAEYHIYDGPFKLGDTFPDKAFQTEFLNHLAFTYNDTPWSLSVDAADKQVTPIGGNDALLKLPFGVFDDSFLCKQHAEENELNWNAMRRARYLREPAGGEFSYYNDRDQKLALAPNGPHGVSFEHDAGAFHISYMIGNDQPDYQPMARIKQASLACGYKFRITAFSANAAMSRVTVSNTGVAPIYRDAFVAVNGVRATGSLKLLAPGKTASFDIASGGAAPALTIQSDHLVPGQTIGFEANLK